MFGNVYAGKRVLVTGHTGFKGAWLSQWLLHLGATVGGVSAYIPSEPALFNVLELDKKMHDYKADVRDLTKICAIFDDFKPDIVFHLAAQSIVLTAYEDPKATFDTNLGGTINVLEAIKSAQNVQAAVLITSDKCYENVEWDYGYRETDRLGGGDPYSASKACAEIAISAYWRSFFQGTDQRIASARAGNVVGGGDWAAHRIIPDCMRAWSQGHEMLIRHPGATRPWQHVLEPLSGYLWLGAQLMRKADNIAGEAFNFGPVEVVNQAVKTLIDAMADQWSHKVLSRVLLENAVHKEAGLLKLSCDKALRHLDWRALLSFEQVIEMIVAWYQTFYHHESDMIDFTNKQIKAYESLAGMNKQRWAL